MFFSTVAIASVAALAVSASPVKRGFGGRATFYATGLGACGEVNTDSDYIVALNSAQYGEGYPGPECFKQIQISANGKTATATIMDQCPSCSYGELDLSPSLFNHFASPDDGVFQMTWDYVNSNNARAVEAAVEEPTSSAAPTVSSSSAWSAPSSSVVSSYTEASSSSATPTATKSEAASSSVVPSSTSNTTSSASAAIPTVTALVNGTDFAQIAEAVAAAGQVVIVGASSVNGSATNGTTVTNATITFQ
ncbi:hypothetical protein QFC22_004847 [Naganishia vaughanmartiniae]|uniref:Uncharacterized protein n=1 Tax=Naganishia vaughanmartiniae TaxID=1424756 RepID=A0ACC2WYL5_9TREE|nr:hypothetical protein QFC22_004847 [Naganishia vaughanmartiniae]